MKTIIAGGLVALGIAFYGVLQSPLPYHYIWAAYPDSDGKGGSLPLNDAQKAINTRFATALVTPGCAPETLGTTTVVRCPIWVNP